MRGFAIALADQLPPPPPFLDDDGALGQPGACGSTMQIIGFDDGLAVTGPGDVVVEGPPCWQFGSWFGSQFCDWELDGVVGAGGCGA